MGLKSSSLNSLTLNSIGNEANELNKEEEEKEQRKIEGKQPKKLTKNELEIKRKKREENYENYHEPINSKVYNCPRFDCNDKELINYFHENGYVVIKEVANQEEIQYAIQLYWNFLENSANMKENDINTWTDENFVKIGSTRSGILFYNGIQHSDVLWYLRCLPKVKKSFEQIYDTNDLIVSYDGGNIFRPWHLLESDSYSKTHAGWYHVDQGRLLPGFQCIQGLVTLKDVNETTGGFCCIPKSQNYHDELLKLDKSSNPERNYILIPENFRPSNATQYPLPEILPICKAGDLLLWDSRTIHCNTPSLIRPSEDEKSLLRMVGYVCMTPTNRATPEVLQQKVQLYEYGIGTNHWPHHFNGMNINELIKGKEKKKNIEDIPIHQRNLIQGGVNEEEKEEEF